MNTITKVGISQIRANELNKWIENSPYTEQEEVIVLLRQQEAEIEGCHQQALNDSRTISKLVGEMAEKETEIAEIIFTSEWKSNRITELETHPVKKELTDEDLEVITEALLIVGFTDAFINYELKAKALAILKKAQEK